MLFSLYNTFNVQGHSLLYSFCLLYIRKCFVRYFIFQKVVKWWFILELLKLLSLRYRDSSPSRPNLTSQTTKLAHFLLNIIDLIPSPSTLLSSDCPNEAGETDSGVSTLISIIPSGGFSNSNSIGPPFAVPSFTSISFT